MPMGASTRLPRRRSERGRPAGRAVPVQTIDALVRGDDRGLHPRDQVELGQLLPVLAGGAGPWPNPLPGRWTNLSTHEPLPYEEVEPLLTVEVDVDSAFEAGRWRHPLRYRRIRAELLPMQLLRMAGDDWDQPLE